MSLRPLFRALSLPFVGALAVTYFLQCWNLDMDFQTRLWNEVDQGWRFENLFWVQWVYGAGVMPALVVGILSLCILLFGIGRPELAKFRKLSGYFLCVMLVGNGLVANVLLKGLWGRPRPSQVKLFGGRFDFEPALTIDMLSHGKSFVCGHATMGFFFFALALAIPNRHRLWRISVMAFGMALGCLLGWVRMAQGGHFFSDVLWAAVLMWMVAYALFYVFRLHENRLLVQKHEFKYKAPLWAMIAYAPVIAFGAFLGLLGTPYERRESMTNFTQNISYIRVDAEGEITVKRGQTLEVRSDVKGFGVPNSSFRYQCKILGDGTLEISSRRKGYFTELRPKLELIISNDCMIPVLIKKEGKFTQN